MLFSNKFVSLKFKINLLMSSKYDFKDRQKHFGNKY